MRPKSTRYINAKGKPSTKGKVSPDIQVGDLFKHQDGRLVVRSIDPDDNLPYQIEWLDLGWVSFGSVSFTFLSKCKREEQ